MPLTTRPEPSAPVMGRHRKAAVGQLRLPPRRPRQQTANSKPANWRVNPSRADCLAHVDHVINYQLNAPDRHAWRSTGLAETRYSGWSESQRGSGERLG